MRTIKFRAWVPGQKRFYYWGHRIDPHGAYFTGPPSESTAEHQQFTGLKDKNGVEIWEGDLVRFESSDFYGRKNWEVAWGEMRWDLFSGNEQWDNGDYYHGDRIYWSEAIVIGNIYENPELVK